MEIEPIKREKSTKKLVIMIFMVLLLIVIVGATSYAFFNYTKTGVNNTIETGTISFDFVNNNPNINIGNAFPIDSEDLDTTYESTFTITSHNTITEGIMYRVYAVYGEEVTGKTRLLDDVMSFQFIPATDGNGFTTTINNYSTAGSIQFVNGKALISAGLVKNTTDLTSKTYKIKMWIDSSKILISSTTKRANNAEGNPSLADTTSGNATANRYTRNDNTLVSTTLYPASNEHSGKIVYTTKEYKNSYYSIRIAVEAEEKGQNEDLVYFDANGGTVNQLYQNVTIGQAYGLLPSPQRTGYSFLGWKINEADANYITSSTTVSLTTDHVLKAIWQENNG